MESDIKGLVPKLGIVKRPIRLQNSVSIFVQICVLPNNLTPRDATGLFIYIYVFCSQSTPMTSSPPPLSSNPSPFSPTSGSRPPYPPSLSTPCSSWSTCTPEADDTLSVASSVSSISRKEFTLSDVWRPTIMMCIKAPTPEQKQKLLTPAVRNEVCWDVVTQMYAFNQRLDRAFCTLVAKCLVKKYPFMRDSGKNVSGYEFIFWDTFHIKCYFALHRRVCMHEMVWIWGYLFIVWSGGKLNTDCLVTLTQGVCFLWFLPTYPKYNSLMRAMLSGYSGFCVSLVNWNWPMQVSFSISTQHYL